MEEAKIIDLYFARDERAVAETAQKYGAYCFSLANAILPNRQDAEETVSETYRKTCTSIPPHRPAVLKLFLAKITRNLAFTRWRSIGAQKRGGGEMVLVLEELSECAAATGSAEDVLNGKELAKAIRAFLDTIPSREQDIFLRRYFFVEESATIAKHYGMKQATVLRTLSRTRMKLKQYLAKDGYAV